MPARRLVLFDFDGTLTAADSLAAFLRGAYPPLPLAWRVGRAMPYWLMYRLGIRSADVAKEAVFSVFFRGWSETRFQQYCAAFARQGIPRLLRPSAWAALRRHLEAGDEVWIVSASPEDYLIPWARTWGGRVIATRIEKRDGRLTGRFASPNCRGPEKVRRIREAIPLDSYDEIVAYGDSPDDRPMLALAHRAYYRPF